MASLDVTDTATFDRLESSVRSYCRSWPVVFERAVGSRLYDENGEVYLDFFAGAGALNYGHNNPALKAALLEYLDADHIVQSLDMFSVAKREFLLALDELILRPRELDYRVQFPGPAGTNAVEAALKLARKVTGRSEVVCFTGGFHGVTLGSLSVTSNRAHRAAAGVPLEHATAVAFGSEAGLAHLDELLNPHGQDLPAAVIVETVQGEGGVNVASADWLQSVAEKCRESGVVLIVDDVQMGCGRTGPFFSFEDAGIKPDIVCLSKSIGGYGLPLALTLIRPELDVWAPGEHNGTFRGFTLAFVTGAAALRTYWQDDALERTTVANGSRIGAALAELSESGPGVEARPRGRGMIRGLAFAQAETARRVSRAAFERGLLVELAGPDDEVVKLMPPLTIAESEIEQGLAVLAEAVQAVC
jgi:diaminobutyrate-2-oxoglutarate transaminase